MTSTIEGHNYVGSLLEPLLKEVGSRMLWKEVVHRTYKKKVLMSAAAGQQRQQVSPGSHVSLVRLQILVKITKG
jgi:hypothetical protein